MPAKYHTIPHGLSDVCQNIDEPGDTQWSCEDALLRPFWSCAADMEHQLEGVQPGVEVAGLQQV